MKSPLSEETRRASRAGWVDMMETVLIVTTIVSIVLAIGMGIVAWRLAREERLRSAARIAALAADLREFDTMREQNVVGGRVEQSRNRPAARRTIDFDSLELRHGPVAVPPPADMFRTGSADRSQSRLATVLAIGSFAVATSLALVIAMSRGGAAIAEPGVTPQATPARADGSVALELVSLSHERVDDQITIQGVIRNPRDGEAVDELDAVVYLFDQDGTFLGTGLAPISARSLQPGSDSSFVVKAGHAGDIRRYRVSFKVGDRVVPHVDRRQAGPPDRNPR